MENQHVAIVTGISSGIGFFVANYLANDNYQVFGILRNETKFHENLQRYGFSQKKNLQVVTMDVRNYTKAKEFINHVYYQYNKIDVLINNAGYGLYGVLEELEEKEIRDQLETNFFAPLIWIKLVLPVMRNQQSGKIINIASILGRVTIPTGSAYCSSKYALVALSEALRYEVEPFGIQVCSVEPGLVVTDFKANIHYSQKLDDKTSPYYKLNRKIKEQLEKYPPYATGADAAAKKIVELVKRDVLPSHYQIGVDSSFLLFLKSILPGTLWDFGIKTIMRKILK